MKLKKERKKRVREKEKKKRVGEKGKREWGKRKKK